ncbi:MAG: radical SAM protein [Clostridiales bacterium]|jgi:oxygen-independent coproporphyrinogen-3 oxidase|nr:radical SAM protein [Clostridiales bacterium]
MKPFGEYAEHAKSRIQQLKHLQNLGLICADGDFVPSVHYPPITQYPPMTPAELYGGYTQPEDGFLDIYVHFPFCERHCVFCHYPGKIGPQTEEKSRYIGYLKREIELYMSRFGLDSARIRPRSILVGGGTPSYLEPEMLADFLEFFNRKVDLSHCAQFNYDVDPNTMVGEKGVERLKIMREYGVTRLTIGVQSLDDSVLRVMNRPHSARTAIEAIYNTKDYGFELNIEFIYGHPGETFENWAEVMRQAVTLPADEIQIYRLKVLAYGDRQGDIIRKRASAPSFEETMTMKQIAIDILNENGFYENLRRVYTKNKKHISHYAYNQCCNLYDQVGFGITAFSSYRDRFALNTQYFADYYQSIDAGELPMNRGYIRGAEQQLRWSIVLPLKNMDVKKAKFEKMNGLAFDEVFQKKAARLKEHGLLEDTGRVVRLTELGGFMADEVAEQFNSREFLPFPREHYADGPLNPYNDNSSADAFGGKRPHERSFVREGQKTPDFGLFTKADIVKLLLAEGEAQQELFARAREARERIFRRNLKVRGVIEISNACVKNCDYCAMRRENVSLDRYYLDPETILTAARQIVEAGISTVFLQSGQNPKCDKLLCQVIPEIAADCGEVLLCAGEKEPAVYEAYKAAGATSYILKFEASNPALYETVTHSEAGRRLACARYIREAGMKLGTGNIIGLPGQTIDDIAEDILFAISLNPDFVSASPFIANKGTPFENMPAGGINLVLNTIAILRIAMPYALIPTVSALEYISPGALGPTSGQAAGLLAGANVITVNFTPKASRDKYAIYASDRFVVGLAHARRTAERAGMDIQFNQNSAVVKACLKIL